MTTKWMGVDPGRDERLDRCPDHLYHFRVKRAHDGRDLLQLSDLSAPDM